MNLIRTLLVAVDCNESSRSALRQAARIAGWRDSQLHVVHVVDMETVCDLAPWWEVSSAEARRRCIDSAKTHVDSFVESAGLGIRPSIHILVGSPIDCIKKLSGQLGVDLVICGSNGLDRSRRAGILATRLVRKLPNKVLVVQPSDEDRFCNIMYCVDFSDNSHLVVEQARRLSQHETAKIHFFHAYRSPWPALGIQDLDSTSIAADKVREHEACLRRRLEEFSGPAGLVDASCHIQSGDTHQNAITQFAKKHEVDLIVLGAKGGTDLDYVLLGSTPERLICDLPCSVLVVRPDQVRHQALAE